MSTLSPLSPISIYLFSRGHATLHLAVSVGPSVGPSVGHIFEFRAVFALLLLSNRPRLDCRVSGLVLWEAPKCVSSRDSCLDHFSLPEVKGGGSLGAGTNYFLTHFLLTFSPSIFHFLNLHDPPFPSGAIHSGLFSRVYVTLYTPICRSISPSVCLTSVYL